MYYGYTDFALFLPFFRCFAIDRSGLLIIHKDFVSNPPKSQTHITTKEPQVAAYLVNKGRLVADTCVSYEDITNQLFWKVYFTAHTNKKLKTF